MTFLIFIRFTPFCKISSHRKAYFRNVDQRYRFFRIFLYFPYKSENFITFIKMIQLLCPFHTNKVLIRENFFLKLLWCHAGYIRENLHGFQSDLWQISRLPNLFPPSVKYCDLFSTSQLFNILVWTCQCSQLYCYSVKTTSRVRKIICFNNKISFRIIY